ncbi:MAG TPA: sugar isomerase, partial [Actinomycetota bacterium]|nr:sugar isomerase [Actinomycetota bacterium]
MNETANEIGSQPACWRTAVGVASASDTDLPVRGQTVAAVGCGTSLYVSRAYAVLREASGHGVTDAFAASEFPEGRRYDRVVAITRNGTTTKVLRLMGSRDPASLIVITADAGAPAASMAAARVVVDFADERSVVQTRFP